jgi:hypothetical protein
MDGPQGKKLLQLYRPAQAPPAGNLPIKNESISLHLTNLFVAEYHELWKHRPESYGTLDGDGEIAVIAKVGSSYDQANTFEQANASSGRLIFFSDNVYLKSRLNVFNEPFFGPIAYLGGPIQLDLLILEVDEEEQKQLLSVLRVAAQAGSKAYAPAAPALAILEQIGTALLDAEGDDIAFRFRMTLDPERSSEDSPTGSGYAPQVVPGHYIFLRRQDREDTFDFEDLWFSPEDCKLYRVNEDARAESERFVEHREDTYVVVRIQSGLNASTLNTEQTLSTFLSLRGTRLFGDQAVRDSIARLMKAAMDDGEETPDSTSTTNPKP